MARHLVKRARSLDNPVSMPPMSTPNSRMTPAIPSTAITRRRDWPRVPSCPRPSPFAHAANGSRMVQGYVSAS